MESFSLIIFGITSNLAQIKLIPALYDIAAKGLLPKDTKIFGIARSPKSHQEFLDYFTKVLYSENRHHQHPIKQDIVDDLSKKLHYVDGNLTEPKLYQKLKTNLPLQGNKMFYLATYPDLYQTVFENLQKSALNEQKAGWTRLLIEKPIGQDLSSAKALNKLLLRYFKDEQIYRLDHYLGKETLQNILTFRFGNGIFEPLINNKFVDHIQITAAEDFGIGKRGSYYDKVGALKDVGQNHLLQMLTFAVMEAPSALSNQAITEQRIKILKSLKSLPQHLVLGQYQGYRKEDNVEPNSQTDTFFAFKTEIENLRFKGVPIYIRGGKRLAQTVTEIAIVFKNPSNRLFGHLECGLEPNILIYRIQPNEGIVLKIVAKQPGHQDLLTPAYMQFCYRHLNQELIDPYEKLLVEAISGNQTFFNDAAEIEEQWKFIDPLAKNKNKVYPYQAQSWGPKQADKLILKDGRCWIEPSMDFCQI